MAEEGGVPKEYCFWRCFGLTAVVVAGCLYLSLPWERRLFLPSLQSGSRQGAGEAGEKGGQGGQGGQGGAGHLAAAGAHAANAVEGAHASAGPQAAESRAGPGGDEGGGLVAKSVGIAEGMRGAPGATDVVLPAQRPIQWGFTFGKNSTARSFEEWDMKSGWSAPARPGIDLRDADAWPSVGEDPSGRWSLEGLRQPLIYAVSLPPKLGRRRRFAQLFRGLGLRHGFEWAPAVDGQLVPPALRWMGGGDGWDMGSSRQPGIWGCYITHLAVMREAHQRCPSCDLVVFEDDIVFRPNFVDRWSSFYNSLPEDWAILRLGAKSLWEPPLEVAAENIRTRSASETWGYVVRASKLKRLGDLLASLPMRGSGIDRVMQLFAEELATFVPPVPLLYGASACHDEKQGGCESREHLKQSALSLLKAWPLGYFRSYCLGPGKAQPEKEKTLQEACMDMQSDWCCPYKDPPSAHPPHDKFSQTRGTIIDVGTHVKGGRRWYMVHIPKAAGTSVAHDLCRIVPEGMTVKSAEMCASPMRKMRQHPGDGVGVLLRQPRSHVLSQFLMCKSSTWGQSVVPKDKKHIVGKFQTWLEHFRKPGQLDDLNCYHPQSMQTRTLSCLSDKDEASHHAFGSFKNPIKVKDPLGGALKTLRSMTFVGLVERYQESLCLFAAVSAPTEDLPVFCNCADQLAWSSFQSAKKTHGLPGHGLEDVTKEELSLLDELTVDDAKLYKAAVKRFETDVRAVEKKRRVQILCSQLTEHV